MASTSSVSAPSPSTTAVPAPFVLPSLLASDTTSRRPSSPSSPPKFVGGSAPHDAHVPPRLEQRQQQTGEHQEEPAAKAAACPRDADTQHSTPGRYTPLHSAASQHGDGTAARAGSTVDSPLASTDGHRKVRDGLVDFSFNVGEVEGVHRHHDHHPGAQHAAVEKLLSAPFVASSPTQQQRRGSWHCVKGGGLSLGGSLTQVSTSLLQDRLHGPPRGESTEISPPPTPPASVSLSSLRDRTPHTLASNSPPPTHEAGATPLINLVAAQAKKERRRPYRLDSAQARRDVMAKQRHRRLLELSSVDHTAGSSSSHSGCRNVEGQGDARKKHLPYAGDGASAGWIAALSSSTLTRDHPKRVESELPSTYSGVTSPSMESSAPLSNTVAAARVSSTGAAQRSATSATAAPPAQLSRSSGSFKTTASLTSLQHRLWQYTVPGKTAAPTTAYKGAASGRAAQFPLSSCLPPSTPPGRLPPLPESQRTAVRQGRRGQCAHRVHIHDGYAAPALHPLTYPPPTVVPMSGVPVAQWQLSLQDERTRGQRGKRMAQWLVQKLLTTPPSTDFHRSRYDSLTADNGGHEENISGGGLLRSLSERAAVAAYLLSTLVEDALPRHQHSMLPYVRMLIDFAFVPDTPAIRAAMGTGTVQDEELLDRLARYDRCSIPLITVAAHTTSPSQKVGRLSSSLGSSEAEENEVMAVDLTDLLAPSFTRMTYIAAHFELSGMAVALAHEVRCRELHHRNVPRLLERTHKNWMRGLMRAVLRAWRHLCQERRVQQQRQRARWALRWTSERTRISLRRWRGYAAFTLQLAEADNVAKVALLQKRAFIERMDAEATAMQRASEELQEALQRQDEEREVVEETIAEREILYQRLLQQVREVDRVGSLMLNSLLLEDAPPRFDDATMITSLASPQPSHSGSHRGSVQSAKVLMSPKSSFGDTIHSSEGANSDEDSSVGDEKEEEELRAPHAVTALPSLLQWAKDCCRVTEAAFLAAYPAAVNVNGMVEDEEAEEGAGEGETEELPAQSPSSSRTSPSAASSPASAQRRKASVAESDVADLICHPPLDFDALLLSTTSDASGSDASVAETVLLPLHKLLLLIRGCSGVEGEGAEEGTEGGEKVAATTEAATKETPLSVAKARFNLMGGAEGEKEMVVGVEGAASPSLAMIRTVQLTDAAVLKEAHALLDHEAGALIHRYSGDSPRFAASVTSSTNAARRLNEADAPPPSGVPLMLRLSAEKREMLQRVCHVVIDAYEQLTGTASVVTAEQLFERSRGTLLVFLAALMRHFTNWMVRRTQQALPATTTTTGAEASAAASESDSAVSSTTRKTRRTGSSGETHQRYDAWSHPPHSHRQWRRQVRRQAEWIALSFSALHDAMRVATLPPRVLTVRQHDHVSGLLEQLSLTELTDLLPSSPDQTMQCYVSLIAVVERYAPSLHLLFHQFALPLAQLRADGGAGAATPANSNPNSSIENDGAQSGGWETEMYVTANTVWHLLCMTGLAGKVKEAYCTAASRLHAKGGAAAAAVNPPLAATLHRPAVFSLIEQVTQHGVTPTTTSLHRASMRRHSTASHTQPDVCGGVAGGGGAKTPVLVQTVSCRTRPRACYAQAVRESRHMDLRADTGAVCVNYTQFVKVLIRLAHAWQCQQQQREAAEHDAALQQREEEEQAAARHVASQDEGNAEADNPENAAATSDSSKERNSNGSGDTTSTTETAFTSTQRGGGIITSVVTPTKARVDSVAEAPKDRQRSLSSTTSSLSAPSLSMRVEYETGNYARILCLSYFDAFIGELLLPRLLGAHRWIGAAQRAMCSRPVLQVLAQHHDALVGAFRDFQRPHEARGVRAALPPPYSTVLASQLFLRVIDAERQASSGLTVGGGRGMSHVQRASFIYRLHRTLSRRGSSTALFAADNGAYENGGGGGGAGKGARRNPSPEDIAVSDGLRASAAAVQVRDISIVSVLQWKDVLALWKEMRWWRIPRLTEDALRLCFEHVQADVTREGDGIFFPEFLQLLCAVASYASPSPAVPLEVKLKGFLELYVLSTQD